MSTYKKMKEIEFFLRKDIVTSDENVINLYDFEKLMVKGIDKFNLKQAYDFENKMKERFSEYSFLYCFYQEQVSSLMLGMGHTDLDFRIIKIKNENKHLIPSVVLDDWDYCEEELEIYKDFFAQNILLLSSVLLSLRSFGNFFQSNIDYNQLESLSNIKISIIKSVLFNFSLDNILNFEQYSSLSYNGETISTIEQYTESENIKKYILGHKEELMLRKGIEIRSLPQSYQKILKK